MKQTAMGRQAIRTGWLHDHLQTNPHRSAFQSRFLQLLQAVQAGPAAATTDLGAIGAEHLGGVRGGDPRSIPTRRRSCMTLFLDPWLVVDSGLLAR